MPFALWPAQVRVLWALMTTRLVIILKARQLGISWLCCWYALWLCVYQPGKTVLLFSKGQDEANELLRRVKVLYERLPEWMRQALRALRKSNTEELAWANGSRIRSLPASSSAGRSFTASLVVLDEAAFLQFADAIYTALKPTIDAGGQLIILSTANGIGNLFHQLWTKAVAGLSTFTAIFLPWWSRPGRDAAWHAAQLAEYTDPAMVKQEYPASATEAFLVSGRTRFDPDWIARQANNVTGHLVELPPTLWHLPGLAVYRLPAPGRRTVLAADVAEGLEHGDYSAVLVALKALGTPKGYIGDDGRPGWLTTAQSKPLAIDLLAQALRDGLITIRTQATLDELAIYRITKSGDTSAPAGYHDDRVMSLAIGLMVARRPPPDPASEPQSASFSTW